jgi:hypothetical protein
MNTEIAKRKRAWIPITAGIFAILAILFFGYTGFVVIQPLGAFPNGMTIWYAKQGLPLRFVESADGFLVSKGLDVTLLGRGMALSTMLDMISDKTIAKLPYIRPLYLISTGGREYGQ